jgi:hypothetical protein
MKRLGVLCVLVFLPLGVLAQTYDYADYFPLAVGDQWVYQEQGYSNTYQVEVTGTRVIHGVVTSVFEFEDPDIPKEFFGADSQGVLGLYGATVNAPEPFGQIDVIPDSPFPIGDRDVQVGDIFTRTERIEIADLGPFGKVYADVTYTASYTNAGEIVVTPTLVFADTLTLHNTLEIDVDHTLGSYNETFTEDVIVARGTGVVRLTDIYENEVYNLISAQINGGLLPDLLNNSSVTYTFDSGQERWDTGGASFVFTDPNTSSTSGRLGLQSTTNTNTFGFWTSLNELYWQANNTLYRAQCTVSTDITDPTKVPKLRLRFNTQNNQLSSLLGVESNSSAASAPTPSGQTYTLYFCPHNSGISTLVPTMSLAFDMLNFNPDDAATGSLELDNVTISRLDLASLPGFTSIPGAAATFDSGTDGWGFFSVPVAFSEPTTGNSGNGSLRLQAVTNTNTFGGWQSPTIALESSMAYRARFRVSSDLANPAQVPGFRMRLNTNNLEMSTMLTVNSTGQGEASPTTTPKDYWVYFAPPASAVAGGMIAAIDIMNFDPADSATGTIQLEDFSIEKASLPLFP